MLNYKESSTLRVTSKKRLIRYIISGKYDELRSKGYNYNPGCGKFTKEPCTCNLCLNHAKPQIMQVLADNHAVYYRPY